MDIRRVATRVSTYAFGAVVVIVATGVVQSLREVGSFYALFHTTYGRTLIVKVGIVAAMLGVASFSRASVRRIAALGTAVPDGGPHVASMPMGALSASSPVGRSAVLTRTGRGEVMVGEAAERVPVPSAPSVRRLRRSVLAEAAVAVAVLVVTAFLVNAAPAKQAAAQPFTRTFDVLGVQVNAVIGPARVGSGNQFHFYVLGRLGQPQGIPELDASMSLPAQSVGPIAIPLRVGGPGHYLATRVTIPLSGVWQLKLTVRTSPVDEQQVMAAVSVR
jgi:copper transport protein